MHCLGRSHRLRSAALVLVAHGLLPMLPVAAPEREPSLPRAVTQARWAEASTLADLHHLRDRLRLELAGHPTVTAVTRSGVGTAPMDSLAQLWQLERRLAQEDRTRKLWQWANQRAAAAIALGDPATLAPASLQVVNARWDEALLALGQIPANSLLGERVATQRQQYQRQRAIAAYHHDTARSGFLLPIVEQAGPAAQVRLTVCTLQRQCRRWQGHRPPANPASLIKVPIAIALMANLHQAGIAPSTPLWVSPGNWTEDAGTIWVKTEYPLERIMADMVSASGNIATNQLIDYLGWEGVNQMLHSRGYRATRIRTKLVGETTYPANAGNAPNTITTDELTDMMVAIYNREIPHANLIQVALANQRDRALGQAAVQPPSVWLGEKTGRNSKVLGTTTAVSVGGDRYIITATLDHSASEAALQSIVAGVIQHLLAHGGFERPAAQPGLAVAATPARLQAFLP